MKKQFLPLNLQFFADDPAGDPTPKAGIKPLVKMMSIG